MDFVYPYNLHDTTYYYYEPPVLDMMNGMQMMDLNAGGGGGQGEEQSISIFGSLVKYIIVLWLGNQAQRLRGWSY